MLALLVIAGFTPANDCHAVSNSIIDLSASAHQPGLALVVDKQARKLNVWTFENNAPKLLFSTDVDIGKGSGVKLKRGDLKTPEGVYMLVNKKFPPEVPRETYGDLAFTTNYPNYFDRLEGKTGDGIWLHAVPDSVSLNRGSKGCVVVRNNSILQLDALIRPKHTPIVILDRDEPGNEAERVVSAEKVKAFMESWRSAWQAQDMAKYLSNYASKFRGSNMNLSRWKAHKQRLAQMSGTARVEVEGMNILRFQNEFVVSFSQKFTSNHFSDEGDKVLYLGYEGKELKIFAEDFLRDSVPSATASLK
ncbi:MAG: murein L,D-transpeptidase family protein [Bacteriovoracia bacterium]